MRLGLSHRLARLKARYRGDSRSCSACPKSRRTADSLDGEGTEETEKQRWYIRA